MILLQSKSQVAMFVEWVYSHPFVFFSIAFLLIYFFLHFEGLLSFKKHKEVPKSIAIWSEQDSEPAFNSLNRAKLSQAEAKLGYHLPKLLAEQLLEKNGGATQRLSYHVQGNAHAIIGDSKLYLNRILGINLDNGQENRFDILSSLFFWEIQNLPKGFVVIAEAGNAWLLLDYTDANSEPSVKYWNPSIQSGIKVASSWESFCAKLIFPSDGVKPSNN